MLRMLGADVVGMSTVPEVITARHSGIKVMAMSLVTNSAVLESGPPGNQPELANLNEKELEEYLGKGMANHAEVLEAGKEAAKVMQALIEKVIEEL
jgi:purine-nucleoside phosphorylase